PPPLHVLPGVALHRGPDLRRPPRVRVPGGSLRDRGRDARDVPQRPLPRWLHLLLPQLPPPLRRCAEPVLESTDPLRLVEGGHPAERTAPDLRVALALQRGTDRSLHPSRLDGGHPGPPHRLLTRDGERVSMKGLAQQEVHEYDVVVIGAGGAGLRAAIESAGQGARTAIVCKSLLGKAHTVMAEGGIAAALRNVWPEDSWQVPFPAPMRGGKMLNHWRMAQLHAQEAPDRVLELERWGALFDRTNDGRILQRDFGGHPYPPLAPLRHPPR